MGGVKRCILMLLMCILAPTITAPPASATASQPNSHGISFNQENGMIFDDFLQLNGSSTSPLTDYVWRLSPIEFGSEEFASGKFTSVLAVTDVLWNWELIVNVSTYDCTCVLHIFDSNESIHPVASTIAYLGTLNHHPHILKFSPLTGIPHLSQSNLRITIPVVIPDSGSQETFVKMGVCPAPNGFCLTEMVDFFNFKSTTSHDQIQIDFDRVGADLTDGYWLFNITITDALLRTSNTEHFRILVDQNLPVATLSCDVNTVQSEQAGSDSPLQSIVIEENTSLSFSALIDDGYAGGQNILTWTLVLPDNSRRALLSSEQISESVITLSPEISGIWSVELLVRDTAGWLSHFSINFTVENVAPVAMVELDSFVVLNGASVSLSAGENWTLNSGQSMDSENDIGNLLHTWYVNGKTLATGTVELNSSDFPEPGVYDVLLVVQDDDGLESELAFEVKISEYSDPSTIRSSTLLLSGSVSVVLLLIFGVLVISRRKKSRDTVVPKWNSKNDMSDKGRL